MAHFQVDKEFYQKIANPGMPSPTVNKYSEHCQKQHMPTKVKVLPKKSLVKAIEFALQKGGDISKNTEILRMCEEVEVSKLNEKNFCCISHRWCTSDVEVDAFAETFSQFLKNTYLCADDTCFEEKTFFEHASNWWSFVGKLVELIFDENGKNEVFLKYLLDRTTLFGFKETEKAMGLETDNADDLQDMMSALLVGKSMLQMDTSSITESYLGDETLEKIKRYLIFAVPQGATPQIKQHDIAKLIKKIKDQKIDFQKSKPDQLFAQISDVIKKTLDDFSVAQKVKDKVHFQRFTECVNYVDQLKTLKNKSNKFNGQDPIAMVTLMMLQNSAFEYFWVDVFCTPQRKEDIDETLKAVQDGMAVFSIATVIVCPPFMTDNLIRYSEEPLAGLIDESAFDPHLSEYYKKFPFLTLSERCFLFGEPSYFDRMWTLHEMAIGHTLYYWWQYLFGPFSKTPSAGANKSLTFRIDSMFNNNYRAGLDQSSYDTTMSRSTAVSTLRQFGPGDGLTTMFQVNFATMQTGFAMDWEILATSIFKLEPNRDVSEQILHKKLSMYQSYLIQYSPPGSKYSHAWFKNPEHVNHSFKFNDKWELIAGCVENPSKFNPNTIKFKAISGGDATLGSETVLKKCSVYSIKEISYEGLFSPTSQYTLYHMIGPRKSDLEKELSSGYLIIGEWSLPPKLAEVRKETVKIIKENTPKQQDKNMKKSYQMMFDYLTPKQNVMMVKSANPKYDFMLVFGVIPNQMDSFTVTQPGNEKAAGNKKIKQVEFMMS